MGDVTLTVYTPGRGAGAHYTDDLTAATSANDYYFSNDGNTRLVAESAAGSTVTVEVVKLVDGQGVTDLPLTAAAGDVMIWGPFPKDVYNDSDGKAHVTVSANTNLFVVK